MQLYTCENRMTKKYIVNKEKRTVVCIITTYEDRINRLYKYGLENYDVFKMFGGVKVYKGIAKCAPEDEWDETYGKRLAEYRACKAREVDVNNALKDYIKKIRKRLDNLEKYGMLKPQKRPEQK